MNRKTFAKLLLSSPILLSTMTLKELNYLTQSFASTPQMPLLFVGHGNPMNAISNNQYAQEWQKIGQNLPTPSAILCISAHWETNGTFVTAMQMPQTIHDFGGFPQALFDVQYPAQGNPALATQISQLVTTTNVQPNYDWGLDHGCWSVLKHIYPKNNIPVLQLSLNYNQPLSWHYSLAKELHTLRQKGVLIIGSGNIVHNLGIINWQTNQAYDWAIEANNKIKSLIIDDAHQQLINYTQLGSAVKLAIPTTEHYLPLLYILGLKEKNENISFFNDTIDLGSIAMTSLQIA